MKQEYKELLLQDLCSRLSYGVKISVPELWTSENKIEVLDEIFKGDDGLYRVNGNGMLIENIKPYYSERLNLLVAHKKMLDKRFRIFESRGIVGERLWDLEGGAYLDYCHRVKPILNKRIAWYKKKQSLKSL